MDTATLSTLSPVTPNAINALTLSPSSYAFAYVEFNRTQKELTRYEATTGKQAPDWMYDRLFAREDALKAFGEVIG